MRILSLAPSLPYPADHGQRLRTWGFLSRIARADDVHVTLVTWREEINADEHVRAVLDAIPDTVLLDVASVDLSTIGRARRQARFVAGGPPPYVQHLLDERAASFPRMHDEIRRRHADQPFDVVVIEDEGMTHVPLPELGVPRVVHRLQVFEQVLADQRRLSRAGRAAWWVERGGWARFDRHASAGAALSIATTPESAAVLGRALPAGAPVVAITNGVEMASLSTPVVDGTDVTFVGWMAYPPNADAALWFGREMWPAVHRDFVASTFRVVGREPSAEVEALGSDVDGVVVTGEVPDVAVACEGTRVGVAPLRAGMGIKNKVLELMAMGVPVVATSAGAEGNLAAQEDGLFIADDVESFSLAVRAMLADAPRAAELGCRAREFVVARFGWDVLAERLLEQLRSVVGAAR
ncbi:MAG TPA: glycosyltransferase family 4 protein [Acidimicrobiales bacterium]|nr:glycosyltransferase family 4 protein [Acidimicrobiales bacterium]